MATATKKFHMKIVLPDSFTTEPLFLLLKNIKLINPTMIFGIFFAVGFVDQVIIGALSGYWNSRTNVVGVFDKNNISALIMFLIVVPGLWAFFVGFPGDLFELFHTIRSKGILHSEPENFQNQVDGLRKIETSWLFRIGILPLALLLTGYSDFVISKYHPIPWYFLGWHFWLFSIETMGAMYVAVYSAGWSLLALITLNRIFHTVKLKVNPYDEDNVGGLRFVGNFILKVIWLIVIIVPFLIAETLFAIRIGNGISGQFNLWLEIIILPFLLGILIYLPLSACREAMLNARDEYLRPLGEKINGHVIATHTASQISKNQLEDISALIDFQAKLRKDFPTWPFDISMFRQIGAGILLSLIPVIINIVQQITSGR